jgi:crossover junction endodeoxyribonuclease RusA
MTHDNVHLKAWRTEVGWAMRAALKTEPPAEGDVALRLAFVVQPRHKGDQPDLDKLCRAVLDALTGIAYLDDKQVVRIDATRRLTTVASEQGVAITLEPT